MLIDVIQHNTSLTKLEYGTCFFVIFDDKWVTLWQTIDHHPSLNHILIMHVNEFTPTSQFRVVADMMKSNHQIEYIQLNHRALKSTIYLNEIVPRLEQNIWKKHWMSIDHPSESLQAGLLMKLLTANLDKRFDDDDWRLETLFQQGKVVNHILLLHYLLCESVDVLLQQKMH